MEKKKLTSAEKQNAAENKKYALKVKSENKARLAEQKSSKAKDKAYYGKEYKDAVKKGLAR